MCKKLFFLSYMTLVLGFISTNAAGTQDPNLVAHWKLDDGSGTIAYDSSMYGNDGTIYGDPNWTTGFLNGALEFDGLENYIDCGNAAILNMTKAVTISTWVHTANAGLYNNHMAYVTKSDHCFALKYFYDGSIEFHIYDEGWFQTLYPVDETFNEDWHHLAGTYDGSVIKLYIDGSLTDTNPHVGSLPINTYNVYIGSCAEAGGRFYSGVMDDVQIYDRALAEPEVQSVMVGGKAISFTASLPVPDNEIVELPQETVLSWNPGFHADKHNVYFGINFNDVNEADIDDPRGVLVRENQDDPTYDPGLLDYGRTYYWRIDEINDTDPNSPWRGNVWSFTIRNFIIVDDFEDYDDSEPNRVFETWEDGWETDDNSAEVGYALPDLEASEHYIETSILPPRTTSKQSMPYFYNTNMMMSEAWLPQSGQDTDWTRDGVVTLFMRFRGYRPYMGDFVEDPAGIYTVTGAGEDIFGTTDQFHFAYKEITGKATIVAKVESIENTDPFAKAGIMMRDTLDANARYSALLMTPENGVRYQYRTAIDDATEREFDPNMTAPHWVKIERTSGGLIRAHHSEDGSTWTQFSLKQLSVTGSYYVGMAVTSHDPEAKADGVFSNVSITGTGSDQPWQNQDVGMFTNTPEPIFIALNDCEAVYYEELDPNFPSEPTLNPTWRTWEIPLQTFEDKGVDLTNVQKMTIGVGTQGDTTTPGGNGKLYIDDIRLYRPTLSENN